MGPRDRSFNKGELPGLKVLRPHLQSGGLSRTRATVRLLQIFLLSLLCSTTVVFSEASACPKIYGLPDYNCDGVFTISFFGDSILRGRLDPLFDGQNGSVPLRLIKRLKQFMPRSKFKVLNFSTPGITCPALRSKLRTSLRLNMLGVAKSDVAIFNCGINDYLANLSSESSLANLSSMQNLGRRNGIFSVVANVSRTNTPSLQRWIDTLNGKIKRLGAYLRFDLLNPTSMVGADKIHPNGDGFSFLFETFYAFLMSPSFVELGETQLKLQDADHDGVYDAFETSKFGTAPSLADTDGDLLNDGSEVFTYNTNPLVTDTDADGIDDYSEIADGSNPRRKGR